MLKINPIKVELKPGSKPYHAKPFPIAKVYYKTTRKECDQFEKIGVWYRNLDSEWAAVLYTTKKDW